MLARLQKFTTLGALSLAALWALWAWRSGHATAAVVGALLLVGGYTAVLGVEFVLLARANRLDPAPRATPGQLLLAWWGEVRSAPIVFCWRQPFRSNLWPDRTGPEGQGRRGVVFVHGFVCNRGLWNPWLARLSAQDIPFVAVNLEPVFGSIDAYAAAIESAVRAVERSTGLPPVVVAHSMGGLALRRWWTDPGNTDRVHHAITLGTPHHGTWLARFAMSPNGHQMQIGSAWLGALAARESPDLATRMTCFFSHCDNIVFPASTATMPGADNRHIAGVAHVHMADRPEPYEELMRQLRH